VSEPGSRRAGGNALSGFAEPGFEAVAEAFARAVPAGGAGGAFCAVVDGRPAVDLWTGIRDGRALWQERTAAVVFSGTKGVVATAVLTLVDRGALDLSWPVARVWPEFSEAGKGAVHVADVMAHTAGLPGVVEPVPVTALRDPASIAALLARQAPLVPVGMPSYHALTYGWLVDEIVRRVDGRGVAQIVAEHVAAPLGLDLWIGVPDDILPRVAQIRRAPEFVVSALAGDGEPDPRLRFVYGNPPLTDLDWSSPALLQASIPGANAVATARSLARLYGCLARGGEIDGTRLLAPETVDLGRRQLSRGADPLSGRPLRFGVGFELAGTPSALGPAADAFGHTGSGGSSHGAWPSLRTGFSFVTALMCREDGDTRARSVLAALHAALTGSP
jgi:CubicO group peptidase (beta-lactamase class C family)